MKSVVLYATRTGNTHMIAEAIADALRRKGDVRLIHIDQAPPTFEGVDLLVIGGPTEGHGMTEPVKAFFATLAPGAIRGLAAAAFDTRVDWPRILSGSAATGIAKKLHGAGARVIVPAEDFIVDMKPKLLPGELERARAWATSVADMVTAAAPVLVGAAPDS